VFFVTRAGAIAHVGAGRFRSANRSAAGLLDLNFRISNTICSRSKSGWSNLGNSMDGSYEVASSKRWRAPPETESPLSNPTTYDGVRSIW
jgi:hypothetical protein